MYDKWAKDDTSHIDLWIGVIVASFSLSVIREVQTAIILRVRPLKKDNVDFMIGVIVASFKCYS